MCNVRVHLTFQYSNSINFIFLKQKYYKSSCRNKLDKTHEKTQHLIIHTKSLNSLRIFCNVHKKTNTTQNNIFNYTIWYEFIRSIYRQIISHVTTLNFAQTVKTQRHTLFSIFFYFPPLFEFRKKRLISDIRTLLISRVRCQKTRFTASFSIPPVFNQRLYMFFRSPDLFCHRFIIGNFTHLLVVLEFRICNWNFGCNWFNFRYAGGETIPNVGCGWFVCLFGENENVFGIV